MLCTASTDPVFPDPRQRFPSPSPPQQTVPDLAVNSVATAMSLATSLSSPLSFSCTTASTRSSPARAAAELVVDEAPAMPRPRHLVH